MSRAKTVDLVRPILADDVARIATMIEATERDVREHKHAISVAGYELIELKISIREAVAALEAHDHATDRKS